MMLYAAEDTHYLLGLYDRLRNQLLSAAPDGSLLAQVWADSHALCVRAHEMPRMHAGTVHRLAAKLDATTQRALREDSSAGRAFAALAEWRDRVARQADVSPDLVLPRAAAARIAARRPATVQRLFEACHPVPPAVHACAPHVLDLMRRAERGETGGEWLADAVRWEAGEREAGVEVEGDGGEEGANEREDAFLDWVASQQRGVAMRATPMGTHPSAPDVLGGGQLRKGWTDGAPVVTVAVMPASAEVDGGAGGLEEGGDDSGVAISVRGRSQSRVADALVRAEDAQGQVGGGGSSASRAHERAARILDALDAHALWASLRARTSSRWESV
jgi:hypothetical protein